MLRGRVARERRLRFPPAHAIQILSTIVEADNQINNCVVRPDGKAFATVGSDHSLRLYDEKTGGVLSCPSPNHRSHQQPD